MTAGYLQVTIYMSKMFIFKMLRVKVGKFVGWLMYFPALLNCVLMFQNSMGVLNTMSFTLHDLVFPVAWFLMCK